MAKTRVSKANIKVKPDRFYLQIEKSQQERMGGAAERIERVDALLQSEQFQEDLLLLAWYAKDPAMTDPAAINGREVVLDVAGGNTLVRIQ